MHQYLAVFYATDTEKTSRYFYLVDNAMLPTRGENGYVQH